MIMPSKYIQEDEALLGVGAALIPIIEKHDDFSELWDEAKKVASVGNFERFVLALDLLYLMGLIENKNGRIVRAAS